MGPFLQLCATTELFTVAQVSDDSQEVEINKSLESMGAFDAGLRRHRVMFSSTAEGIASMIRQLQPSVHFEAAPAVADNLKGKIEDVRLMGSPTWPTLNDGVRALSKNSSD